MTLINTQLKKLITHILSCFLLSKFKGFIGLLLLLQVIFLNYTYAVENKNQNVCQANILKVEATQGAQNRENLQQWQEVSLPDSWLKRWKNYSGSVWYKVTWHSNCPSSESLLLTIQHINLTGQLFLNDELLWQDKSLEEPFSRNWNIPKYWIIPASSILPNNNVLLIRVIGNSTQRAGLGNIHIGKSDDILPIYNRYLLETRTLPIIAGAINFVLGIFCLFVWFFQKQEKMLFWFSMINLSWVIYLSLSLQDNGLLQLNSYDIERILNITFCFYSIAGCFGAWYFANRTFPRIEKLLYIFFFLSSFILIITPDNLLHIVINIIFPLSVLIFLLRCITYPIIAYQSKKIEVYFLAIIYLIFIPIAINDAHYMLTYEGRVLSPYTSPLSAIFIGFVLALRLSNNMKKIEGFNTTLQDKIYLAKNELESLVSKQHKLEIENIKLQERMNLAHDLHDSLGGSLVRSMAIINQSQQNLSNQQFLSMLKLLRDDLRQIIDSGSSSGTTIPETPTIWGAAIRYRFMQIFDELDIESNWSFPKNWEIRPSSLECLTLLRIIEESLTNIIKHSQAKFVRVNLYFHESKQLILEIEDNGIGFDVAATLDSGLSIGIRSMQVRVEKIHAEMSIHSVSGHTTIKVVKSFASQ